MQHPLLCTLPAKGKNEKLKRRNSIVLVLWKSTLSKCFEIMSLINRIIDMHWE